MCHCLVCKMLDVPKAPDRNSRQDLQPPSTQLNTVHLSDKDVIVGIWRGNMLGNWVELG